MIQTIGTTKLSSQECRGHLGAISDAISVIGGKWKLRILAGLGEGHKRFNELQRAIEGISPRVLSSELKDLELNGFVTRKADPFASTNVEYELTPYANTLQDVLRSLQEWGAMHAKKIRGRD